MHRRALAALTGAVLLLFPAPAPGWAAAPTTGTIGGIVLDEGRPVPGATVCFPSGPGCNGLPVTTGADGRFRMTDLAPGSYRLKFTAPGGGLQQFYPEDPAQPTFTLAAGQVVEVTEALGPHGAMAGRVLDNQGEPAAGAVIGLDVVRHPMSAVTDADGYYKLDYLPETTSGPPEPSPSRTAPSSTSARTRSSTTTRSNSRRAPSPAGSSITPASR